MAQAASPRTRAARELFAPLGPTYDRYARLLSFGQDPRWRSFLVERIEAGPGDVVLDVATGTGAVALELVRQKGCSVVGIDQSAEMLEEARRRIALAAATQGRPPRRGRAEELPFEDGAFDALTVTYLLRYVDDPGATLAELARVVRSGGTLASLEFGVPPAPLPRAAWELYTGVGAPTRGPDHRDGLERGRRLPPRQHSRLLRATAARSPARPVARGRRRGHPRPPAQPRRRDRDLGAQSVTAEARPGLLCLALGRVARLRHAPPPAVHDLAPELRRDRSCDRPPVRLDEARAAARRLLPRGRDRRARPRRIDGAAAANENPAQHADRPVGAVDRRCGRDRHPRRDPLRPVAARLRRLRCVHRRRVQPRAGRRPLPRRGLVLARLGSIPGADRVLHRGGRAARGGVPRRGLRLPAQLRAAAAVDGRAHRPPEDAVGDGSSRIRRRNGASRSMPRP